MSANAAARILLQRSITSALAKCGASVSNLKIGSFGITMDAATETDAAASVKALKAAGCTRVDSDCWEGDWMVVADLPA